MAESKPMTGKEKIQVLWRGIKGSWKIEPLAMSFSLVGSITESLRPFINIYFPARIIGELMGDKNIRTLTLLVCLALGLNLVLGIVKDVASRFGWDYEDALYFKSSGQVMKSLLKADYETLENPEFQDFYERYRENGPAFGWINCWICNITRGLISVAGSVVLMAPLLKQSFQKGSSGSSFIESPWFAIVLLLAVIGVVAFVLVYSAWMNKRWYRLTNRFVALNKLFAYYDRFFQDYKRGKEVRLYREQELLKKEMTKNDREKLEVNRQIAHNNGSGSTIYALIGAVVGCGVYLFVGLKGLVGLFGVDLLVRYAGAFMQVINGLMALGQSSGQMGEILPRTRDYFEILDMKSAKYHGTLPIEKRSDREYEIEFRHVSFRYPGTERWALEDLNLTLRIGKRMAVVGMNGSGKTTMIKLLCRLYDPQEGEILLNGINIKKYDEEEYLTLFSVVFQDFALFSFSLAQNVAASVDYDADRVKTCLEEAGFEERLKQLPRGIETSLYKDLDEKGIEISGGEGQKIALARALYKDAPFIILDEPTAALDPIAEFDIYSRFNEIVEDRTAVYISHRLSSCRFCDDIAVFDAGRMVQRGTHDELIQDEKGKYHELWMAQAQYYDQKAQKELLK